MSKETIVVESLGKWGPKVNGTYYSFSPKCKEVDKGKLVPGGTFEVEIFTAESGKKYINGVTGSTVTAPPIVAPVLAKAPIAKAYMPKAKDSDTMTKAEWSAKDRSQLIGGLSHDAATITAVLINLSAGVDDVKGSLGIYKELLEGMLAIRDEVK